MIKKAFTRNGHLSKVHGPHVYMKPNIIPPHVNQQLAHQSLQNVTLKSDINLGWEGGIITFNKNLIIKTIVIKKKKKHFICVSICITLSTVLLGIKIANISSSSIQASFFFLICVKQEIYCGILCQAISTESQQLAAVTGSSTTLAPEISNLVDSTFKVGRLSAEQRKEKIHKYKKKRNERNFSKKIKVLSNLHLTFTISNFYINICCIWILKISTQFSTISFKFGYAKTLVTNILYIMSIVTFDYNKNMNLFLKKLH